MARKKYRGIPPVKAGPVGPEEKKHSFEASEDKESRNMMFLIIGFLLILIIIGVGVLVFLFLSRLQPPVPVVTPNVTDIANLTNITPTECDDTCMLQLAINTTSLDLCNKINSSSIQQNCYSLLANLSLTACLNLEDKSRLKDCVILHALKNSDTGICSNLAEPDATACLAKVDPCYAKNGTEKNLCLALSKKSYSLCKGDEECLFNYSQTTGTTAACGELGKVKGAACKSIVLKKDECYDLPTQSERDYCYQLYAIGVDDKVICTMTYPDSLYALNCHSYFASKLSDLSVCDSLSLNNRWDCYTNFSMGTTNVSGCVKIHRLATTSRFRCFFEFAKKWGDPSACDLINDPGQTTTCYVGSIMNNSNLDYQNCDDVDRTVWKNKCYTQSAKNNKDSTICDYITTELERKGCLAIVGG